MVGEGSNALPCFYAVRVDMLHRKRPQHEQLLRYLQEQYKKGAKFYLLEGGASSQQSEDL